MKPIRNPAKFSRGFLSVALGAALTMVLVSTGEFAYSFIKGVAVPSPNTFPVSISMANNHQLVNGSKDIYLVDLSGQVLFFKPPLSLQLYSGCYTIILWSCLALVIYLMRNIIQTTVDGNPFVTENGKRIRRIAFLLVLVPLALKTWQEYLLSAIVPSIKIDNVNLVASNGNELLVISITAGIFFLVPFRSF